MKPRCRFDLLAESSAEMTAVMCFLIVFGVPAENLIALFGAGS
jgi:hypothetical protein